MKFSYSHLSLQLTPHFSAPFYRETCQKDCFIRTRSNFSPLFFLEAISIRLLPHQYSSSESHSEWPHIAKSNGPLLVFTNLTCPWHLIQLVTSSSKLCSLGFQDPSLSWFSSCLTVAPSLYSLPHLLGIYMLARPGLCLSLLLVSNHTYSLTQSV